MLITQLIVIINIINKFIDLVTLKVLYLFCPTKCPKTIEFAINKNKEIKQK